jgi:hypothetical protein
MEKEFVTYELALRMKQLGFDEPCLGHYQDRDETTLHGAVATSKNVYFSIGETNKGFIVRNSPISNCVLAPTYSQAFRWFREKYNIHIRIEKYDETKWWANWGSWTSEVYSSYEEAETACLQKLIEIVEQTNP